MAIFLLQTLPKPEEVSKKKQKLRGPSFEDLQDFFWFFLRPPSGFSNIFTSRLWFFLRPPQVSATFSKKSHRKYKQNSRNWCFFELFLYRILLKPWDVMQTLKFLNVSQLPDSGSRYMDLQNVKFAITTDVFVMLYKQKHRHLRCFCTSI